MSCPREETFAIWLDGELPAAERRPLEAHLVQCAGCRARVLALRDEADLLGDALLDRELPALPRREAVDAPARGLALGFVPAAAGVTAVLAAAGWLIENLPSAVEWLNPFQLKGGAEMAYQVIFTIRDEVPGLLGLGVAVAATAGVSAILTFAVTAVLRRVGPGTALGLAALALLGAPSPSEAHFGMHEHDDFSLAAGETHDGTLIVSGATVDIDGIVTGDLFVLAERLSLRGEVRGNLFAFAENVDLSGVVEGSAHLANDKAEISGEVRGDLYAGVEDFEIAPGGRIARDTFLWIDDAVVEGEIGRDLYSAGRQVDVRGRVGRNLRVHRMQVELRDGAEVGGDVVAKLRSEDDLTVADGASIAGETRFEEIPHPGRRLMERYGEGAFYVFLAVQFVAAFLVGMLLHALVPSLFQGRLETASAFFRSMGIGFLAVIATPLAIVVVAVTLVGIPIALMGLFLYLTAIYISTILVGALVGAALVRPKDPSPHSFGLALLAGLAVVIVLAHLPFVGWPVHIVALLAGMGLLVDRLQDAWGRRRYAA